MRTTEAERKCDRPSFGGGHARAPSSDRHARVALLIDQAAWDRFISVHDVLYHVTREENVDSILRDGLRPGSDLGTTTRDDFFQTRSGRTYLIGLAEVPIVDVGPHEPRVFSVELAGLDPTVVDPDEDIVAERFPEMVALPSPVREMDGDQEVPGQNGARARWADESPDFHCSEVTERSLTEGLRMAYGGTIPARTLALMDTRSRVIQAFVEALPEGFSDPLGEIPLEGGWRTEVERARSLVRTMAGGVCDSVKTEASVCCRDAYSAIETSDRLRAEARELAGQARLDEAKAVRHVADVVLSLQDLYDLPIPDLDKAVKIARDAAGLAGNIPGGDRGSLVTAALTQAGAVRSGASD